ncbi:bestrophin-2a-like [Ascaphus truei]|uniref:bestrophin-2a-like n=1 Tax=Ascaphus truei TaxID=8439 RepID=UPI003F5968E0
MTVTYTARVADARFGTFYRLLWMWKGSIYKLFYKELFLFFILYFSLSFLYRLVLNEYHRRYFERVAIFCNTYSKLIPVPFVLSFYIELIVERWWNQYQSIPTPDRLMCVISATVHGTDERGRMYRRTLMRYCSLSALLIKRSVSTTVFKRFPTMEHVVDTGFMTLLERTKYDALPSASHKYWIPCVWFCNLAMQARKEGQVRDDAAFQLLMEELNIFRGNCEMLFHYDWISVPLVYTQVVTIAVYSFFVACLIGRQFLDPKQKHDGYNLDIYFPFFTLLEFFFYAGWLKVGEQLINPFGEDDDDFETNFLIDRNFQVSMLAVDEMYADLPLMERDRHWDDLEPRAPYTVATSSQRDSSSYQGSTSHMMLDEGAMRFQPSSAIVGRRTRSVQLLRPLHEFRPFRSLRFLQPRHIAVIEEVSEESFSDTFPPPHPLLPPPPPPSAPDSPPAPSTSSRPKTPAPLPDPFNPLPSPTSSASDTPSPLQAPEFPLLPLTPSPGPAPDYPPPPRPPPPYLPRVPAPDSPSTTRPPPPYLPRVPAPDSPSTTRPPPPYLPRVPAPDSPSTTRPPPPYLPRVPAPVSPSTTPPSRPFFRRFFRVRSPSVISDPDIPETPL